MNAFLKSSLAAALCVAASLGSAKAQTMCSGYWTSSNVSSANISELVAYDDGTGQTLYASTGSLVRKWTGSSWVTLPTQGWGPGVTSIEGLTVLKTPDGDRLLVTIRRNVTGGENPFPSLGNVEFLPMVLVSNHWEQPVKHHLFKNIFSLKYVDLGDGASYYGLTWIQTPSLLVDRILVRRWIGDGWLNIGVTDQTNGDVAFLRDLDFGQGRALYLWGQLFGFSRVNGIEALGFAKWDGQQWSAPWPERVRAGGYERFEELVEGGQPVLYGFFNALVNGVETKGIGRYDGTAFRGIGGGELGSGQVGGATHLAVMDAGFGPNLFVGGAFPMLTGGIASPGIGRWDGQSWHAVGSGLQGAFSANLTVLQGPRGPQLYMHTGALGPGYFGGGVSPPNTLALYAGCPNCYANCDLSAKSPALTANDFMCFMSKFLVRDPYANCTVDATIDIADFQCFINKFAAGCP